VLVIAGRVYLAGGRSRGRTTAAVYRFDPRSVTVRRVATLKLAVADAGAAVDGGVGYLLGGETPARTDVVQTVTVR
jgi:hypothetical protein